MLRIAIADDSEDDRRLLNEYITQYAVETGEQTDVVSYSSAIDLLEEYRGDKDILFLDIEMPGTDGMSAAKEIRLRDDRVAIVFVTNMAQYAINGYEVEACGFMVKPISYGSFNEKIKRAAEWSEHRRGHHILLADDDGVTRVRTAHILWVEKDRNYLIWHTKEKDFKERGTLATAREKLEKAGVSDSFAECCTGYLVNLDHVEHIGKENLTVDGNVLPISRRLRKDFLHSYTSWG